MRSDYVRITGMALLFFVPFLGGVHLFEWSEISIAESAREMLVTGNYLRPQLDYQPCWDWPPLFLWLQVLSMNLFGVGEFAARFPNAIAGLLTLLLVYYLGRRLHDRSFGWVWALAWLGSLLPHLYFRTGLIDPWFNLLMFLSLYGFIEFRWLFFTHFEGQQVWQRYRYLILGGAMLGLALLMKGPIAYFAIFLTLLAYFARYGFRNRGFVKHLFIFSVAALALPAIWIGIDWALHGPDFGYGFSIHQFQAFLQTAQGQPAMIGAQPLLLLLGSFPISIFALANLWGDRQSQDELLDSDTLASCKRSDMATWMQLLFWVIIALSFFPIAMANFASLAFFPLTYLGSLTIWRAIRWDIQPKLVKYLLPGIGLLIGLAGMALPLLGTNTHWLRPLFAGNEFALARLQVDVDWYWWQGLPGLALILGIFAAWRYWQNKQAWQAAQAMFTGSAIFIAFNLILNIPNIEKYTQCSTIQFYESKIGKNCLVQPLGFSTNAHLFYTRKAPCQHLNNTTSGSCTSHHASPGQKVYFVSRENSLVNFPQLQNCQEIYRKEGVVYFERPAQ